MKIKTKEINHNKYNIIINEYLVDSFDKKYEAIACKKQLELLGDDTIKEILKSRNREN